jgi:hypothetical protein
MEAIGRRRWLWSIPVRVPHLALALLLALAACGSSGRTSSAETTTTPITAEQQDTAPTPATAGGSTTVEPTTRTVQWVGLPSQFPVQPDDSLILTDDSTRSQSLTISRVDLVGVHDWFADGLVAIRFEVTFDDGYNRIEFHGRGSDGVVLVSDRGDGVHIDVVIEQFRPFK